MKAIAGIKLSSRLFSVRSLLGLFFSALLAVASLLVFPCSGYSLGEPRYVETNDTPGNFPIVHASQAAALYVDAEDYIGVQRAAANLQADIHRVTGCTPTLTRVNDLSGPNAILIGTLGKSSLIDRLALEGRLNVTAIKEKWESFVVQTVANPFPGIAKVLVIAGSD
jgi:hypothetical protein